MRFVKHCRNAKLTRKQIDIYFMHYFSSRQLFTQQCFRNCSDEANIAGMVIGSGLETGPDRSGGESFERGDAARTATAGRRNDGIHELCSAELQR